MLYMASDGERSRAGTADMRAAQDPTDAAKASDDQGLGCLESCFLAA